MSSDLFTALHNLRVDRSNTNRDLVSDKALTAPNPQLRNIRAAQMPALNVFTRSDGIIRHTFCTELLFVAPEPGQHPRHADMIWPLWNLFDFTPEGRGTDWHPALQYEES